jgi:uncharacterized protein
MATNTADIFAATSHRPWSLPNSSWVMFQSWRELLFAHWRVPLDRLQRLVPRPLLVEECDGSAWITVAPFRIHLRPRYLPDIPGLSSFLELNVRTYVTLAGKPGVYFFNLDANSRLAVAGARATYRLPYRNARMSLVHEGDAIRFHSRRNEGPTAELGVRYRALGDRFQATSGTLDYFLTERFCLYTVSNYGRASRTEIHHLPWALQRAEARFETNSMLAIAGIEVPDDAPVLHFAARQDVLTWPPQPV